MTPIVFCASLAPCPKDTAAAETSCSPLNAGWSSCALVSRWMPMTRYIAANAIEKATAGDRMMPMAAFSTLAQSIASRPPAARPAPTSPPMIAWLEEDGMPKRHVA